MPDEREPDDARAPVGTAVAGRPAVPNLEGALTDAGAAASVREASAERDRSRSDSLAARLRRAGERLRAAGAPPFRAPLVLMGTPDDDSVYVVVRTAHASAYDVVLGMTPDCSGATYCRVGRLSARRWSDTASAADAGAGRPVTLPTTGRATFLDAACGANCSDAVVGWSVDGIHYRIGLHGGDLRDFAPIARSVVRLP